MERVRLHRSTALGKPGVKHDLAKAIATTPQSRGVGTALEGDPGDLTRSRLHFDFANLRVLGDDNPARSQLVPGPSAGTALATFPPGEKESKCADCQAGGSCPECAQAAEHPGRPLQAADAGGVGSGGPEPDKDEPAECTLGPLAATFAEPSDDRGHAPRDDGWTTSSDTGVRPLEAGWWTSRTPTSNTIGCDGSGSMVVMQNGATYQHGVTDCTIQHEQVHANDWLARYGSGICTGRARGDLPHYDPPGKEAYDTFLKNSECRAWRVGQTCRSEKLAACTTDACREYVRGHVDFAGRMVSKYCGLSTGAKAAIGALGGAAVGAGIGAVVGGPVGALVGGGVGALVGGLGSLLF